MDTIDQLKQTHHVFNRRVFRITESGIRVDERDIFGERSYAIAFESISNDGYMFTRISKYAFWFFVGFSGAGGMLLVLSFISSQSYAAPAIVYFLIACAFGIRFLLSRATFVGYRTSGDPLLLYKDNPSKEAVDTFFSELHRRKHEYLVRRYGDPQPLSPAEELQRLAWLREKGTITEDEFRSLKGRILHGEITRQRPLDFLN